MTISNKKDLSTTNNDEKQPSSSLSRHPLLGLRQEVDTLFDNFFSNFSFGPFGRYGSGFDPFSKLEAKLVPVHEFMPSIDVKETEGEFQVSAELPGMEEANIELSLSDDQLIIKGEKKEEQSSDDENHHMRERRYGAIYRSLALPKGVDEDSIEATYDNGVLTVTMKKVEAPSKASKTIKIKAK